jgi:hypothetical protein
VWGERFQRLMVSRILRGPSPSATLRVRMTANAMANAGRWLGCTWVEKRISPLGGKCAASVEMTMFERTRRRLGEFLKGYMRKKLRWGGGWAGYSQDGDSRGLAQACDKATGYRNADPRCLRRLRRGMPRRQPVRGGCRLRRTVSCAAI